MRSVVWKFVIPARVAVPENGRLVHAGADPAGNPCVWIEVDPTAPPEWRAFGMYGTGRPLPPGWLHCGSFLQHFFVWHIYEAPAGAEVP